MLNPRDSGVRISTAPHQKSKISFPARPAPAWTPLDRYLHQNLGQLTPAGDFARAVRILGPGQTPTGLRNRVIRLGDLSLLRKCDVALVAFRQVERDVKGAACRLPQQGGRHG